MKVQDKPRLANGQLWLIDGVLYWTYRTTLNNSTRFVNLETGMRAFFSKEGEVYARGQFICDTKKLSDYACS